MNSIEASPATHLLVANDWIARFPQENAGPLHVHDCLNSKGIGDEMALNGPRYEGGYLYPTDGPGLGVDLNEEFIAKNITKGKIARTVSL